MTIGSPDLKNNDGISPKKAEFLTLFDTIWGLFSQTITVGSTDSKGEKLW
jgi:hypothetical protein